MKKFLLKLNVPAMWLPIVMLAATIGCKKQVEDPLASPVEDQLAAGRSSNQRNDFLQVNLVANNSNYGAALIDTTLINGWGISFSPTGTFWVSSQGGHVSDVYNREGVTTLAPVKIPSPGGPAGGNPTGQVFNPNAADFIIPAGNGGAQAAARFIFVGVDGIMSAWNGTWGSNSYLKFNHSSSSAYTGLTLAGNGGSNYLYAADFRARKIVVWDRNWNTVQMPFYDARLPRNYAPFNIQVAGSMLYVTYAKVGRDGRSEAGEGKGYVNVFTTAGVLVKRFADREELNAPWGVAIVPNSFFPEKRRGGNDDDRRHGDDDDDDNDSDTSSVLIGNFGDGRISIYNMRGQFRGQLKKNNRTLSISGLWAITLPPVTSTIDQRRLYFAAGPRDERDGLFGYIIQDTTRRHH